MEEDQIFLADPGEFTGREIEKYREEHFVAGEFEIHGSALLGQAPSYIEWLDQLKKNADEATVDPSWVISSTFFAVRERDHRIIGMLDIRHTLNDFLREYGGHVGYGVRPSERRKGYAAKILEQGIAYSRLIGRERIMLACYSDNLPSKKTILHCGGILERTFEYEHDKTVEVYWIDTKL
ncbi:MAG: GNAT family N-acetyltransferase [Clostridia bacterium]|nr:GNAT family N-acetyltransferase [Clostridia bacterium]